MTSEIRAVGGRQAPDDSTGDTRAGSARARRERRGLAVVLLRAPAEISAGIRRVAGRVWRRPLVAIVLVVLEDERVASGASRRRRSRQ
jgi:hypothetical protein